MTSDPVTSIADRLRAGGCVFAEDEARLLCEAEPPGERREALVRRRIAGEPLEQLLGWAEFAGLRILLEPGVFVPRTRTTFLARRAAEFSAEFAAASVAGAVTAPIVLDLCCGAGAIGAAIRFAVPSIELIAADLDPAAVRAARRTLDAQAREAAGGPVEVVEGDLFEPIPQRLRGRISVIAVNAPYVPSEAVAMMPPEARDHEHRLALDGGFDGLELHRRIAAEAGHWLAPGGRLLIECARTQSADSVALFEHAGLEASIEFDEEFDETMVIAHSAEQARNRM